MPKFSFIGGQELDRNIGFLAPAKAYTTGKTNQLKQAGSELC
jgi:hypothetical protein